MKIKTRGYKIPRRAWEIKPITRVKLSKKAYRRPASKYRLPED